MSVQGILLDSPKSETKNVVKWEKDMAVIISVCAGFILPYVSVGKEVERGELLAEIIDPYMGEVKKEIVAPERGKIFFARNKPMVYANTVLFGIIKWYPKNIVDF